MQLTREVDMSFRAVAVSAGIERHDAMRKVVTSREKEPSEDEENGDRMKAIVALGSLEGRRTRIVFGVAS